MIIYVAGPYRGNVEANIANARKVAIAVWEAGHVALCPHLNAAHFEKDCTLGDNVYLSGDLALLARCDALVLCPGWQESPGTKQELNFAKLNGIPIFEYPTIPPYHPTEQKSPVQCSAFMRIIMGMYRTHLQKNADYSPANILGTGEIGLVTRLWDKVARLLNLSGFNIHIQRSDYSKPIHPKNEAIQDTYEDLAVYAVIGMLLRNGEWGH